MLAGINKLQIGCFMFCLQVLKLCVSLTTEYGKVNMPSAPHSTGFWLSLPLYFLELWKRSGDKKKCRKWSLDPCIVFSPARDVYGKAVLGRSGLSGTIQDAPFTVRMVSNNICQNNVCDSLHHKKTDFSKTSQGPQSK